VSSLHPKRILANLRTAKILILIVFFLSSCQKEQVRLGVLEYIILPKAPNITDIVWLDTLRAVACGGEVWGLGTIIETYDGGATWQEVYACPSYLEALAIDTATGYGLACGRAGALHRRDTNLNWYTVSPQNTTWYRGISLVDSAKSALLVSGEGFGSGSVHQYYQGGAAAPIVLKSVPNELSVAARVSDRILMVGGYGYLMRSLDAGNTWNRLDFTGHYITAMAFSMQQKGILITEAGDTFTSQDLGLTWQKSSGLDRGAQSTDIVWADEKTAYACAENGRIYQTTNAGKDWVRADDIPEGRWLSVAVFEKRLLVGGRNGRMLRIGIP
jgi:photosystem II stability/assembly factor-like uncharacterized protein